MSQGQSSLPEFLYSGNLRKAMTIRERMSNDVVKPSASGSVLHLRSVHRHTLEMVRINHYPQGFREVVQAAILDRAMLVSLEQEKRLNWCREVKKLVPLRTEGDGNCLLHAACQYMLGVHDTDLVLRKAVYSVLRGTETHNIRMRFQAELLQSQEFTQTGLHYNTLNWQEEWEKIIKMASPDSNRGGLQFEFLEDIHIFVLSNILRRPILVIADQVLRSMRSGSSFAPLNVGGVYLPLLWPSGDCYKYPIVLGYDSQHFAPLITMKDSGPEIRAVPLAYPRKGIFEELRVHFLMEKEQQQKNKLIKDYLAVIEIPVNGPHYDTTHIIKAARLDEGNLPEDMDLMEDYLQLVNHEFKLWQRKNEPASEVPPQDPSRFSISQLSLMGVRCVTRKCSFYASVDTQPYCHECYEMHQRNRTSQAEPSGDQARPGTELMRGCGAGTGAPLVSPRSAPPTAPSLAMYSEGNAMKCKTPNCPFTLKVEHSGLCERCVRAWQTYPPREGSKTRTGGSSSRDPDRCVLCRQEALRTFNGLCPQCIQRTANTGGEGQQTPSWGGLFNWTQLNPSRLEAIPEPGPDKQYESGRLCKGPGCTFFGTVEKAGYCSVCFVDYESNRRKGRQVVAQRDSPPAGGLCLEAGFHDSSHGMTAARQGQKLKQAQCSPHTCANAPTDWTGFCPECHTQSQREGGWRRTPEGTPKLSCRAPGCDNHANMEKQGYCNECDHFKQMYGGVN
ncbi:hypothetical protein GJAV_G00151380 [Gymnothorax javanicus]|nr:hypothetical protein GJAV_G00151380 [Gymnothorax javanicus]